MDRKNIKNIVSISDIDFPDQTKQYYLDANNVIVSLNERYHNDDINDLIKVNFVNQPLKAHNFIKRFLLTDDDIDLAFRFLIINLSEEFQSNFNEVIELIEEILGEIYSIIINDQLIVFYFDKFYFDFKNIINTLIDDLAIDFEVFEGCKITKRNDFFTIIRLYNTYLVNKFHRYSSISEFVLTIYVQNPHKLKEVRDIFLYDVLQDEQLVNLIKSLFDNNLNVSQSSAVVYMHRNTINNKLDLIKKLTGLNIQNFKDAVAMYLLLYAQ